MRARAPWLEYIPATLLVAVAASQLILAHTAELSPWVGGGFGMFASTDGRGARHLHVVELRTGIERELYPTEELADLVRRARSLPTDGNLRALALALAEPSRRDESVSVRVEVWRTRFDPRTLTPSTHLVRGLEVRVPSGA